MPDIWQKSMAVAIKARDASSGEDVARLNADNRRLREQVVALGEILRITHAQLNGGVVDPHAFKGHAGQILLSLGWKFCGPEEPNGERTVFHRELSAAEVQNLYLTDTLDPNGCYWEDPEESGGGKRAWHCLTGALNIAFRRFLGWSLEGGSESAPKRKPRYERMLEDDDDPES